MGAEFIQSQFMALDTPSELNVTVTPAPNPDGRTVGGAAIGAAAGACGFEGGTACGFETDALGPGVFAIALSRIL
jgi:hypothetical protein